MARLLYKAFSLVTSLLLYPFFYFNKRGKAGLNQRYGCWNAEIKDCIWLHAASFGEVNALSPVIALIRQKYPLNKILITCLSTTGLAKASELADYAFLAPFDNGIWLHRAFSKIKFNALIIAETEIWPAMIEFALKRDVPLFLVNARISDYTFQRYKKLGFLIKPLLNCFSKIICISQESKSRFHELGIYKEILTVGGYSKYDIEPFQVSNDEADKLKAKYVSNMLPVLTLGSIRPGEEAVWFKAIKKCYEDNLGFNVIVAPRHSEKFDYFSQKLNEYGLEFSRYTSLEPGKSVKIMLLDTMGKLKEVYSYTDLAFVGASLVDIGGHNPVEPAASKCAVCMGPYFNNVRDIIETLGPSSGIKIIKSSEDACLLIRQLSEKNITLSQSAEQAYNFWKNNFGASERIVKEIVIQ